MRRPIWLLVAVMLACLALVSVTHTYSTGDKTPPQVIETDPTRGEELPIKTGNAGYPAVTFYFDRLMDQTSVEAAFKVTPSVKGSFNWPNGTTAVFQPSEAFHIATEYMFTIGADARSAAGIPLRDTFSLKLRSAGFLAVSQVLPRNGTRDIEAAPTITIIFNRPVVPLLPAVEMAKLPSPITIQPAAEGEGTWLNTSIYTYKPKMLQGSTTYTVTVNKGLTDVTGTILPEDYVFSFSTIAPRVIEILPETKTTGFLRDSKIQVTFSQPMDHSTTEGAFSLTGPGGDPVSGKFNWDDKLNKLTFQPDQLLDYGGLYDIHVDRMKALSATGGALSKDADASFTVIGAPDILGTDPQDGATADPSSSVTLSFTAPMNLKDFKTRLTIEPKPSQADYDTEPDEAGFYYKLNFGADPSSNYTITLDTNGLVDKYGTPIKLNPHSNVYKVVAPGKAQIQFVTSAFPPSASLKTNSIIGLYSAYRPVTRVYTLHRNVNSVSLSLWSVPIPDFLKMSGSSGYGMRANYKFINDNFLRRWTVPVYSPTNVMRYDLLAISDHGVSVGQKNNILCVDAAPTRLDIGDEVTVLKDDADLYRIRNQAGMDSVITAQVKAGEKLTVIDGPICADKFVWWKLQNKDGSISGWGVEGDKTHYFIGADSAAATAEPTATVSAPDNPPPLKPGVYWLNFSSPDLPDNSGQINHIMLVATANITLKVTPTEALAWVTDLKTGQPISDVAVQFYTGSDAAPVGKPVQTDPDGLARFTPPDTSDNSNVLYNGLFAVVNDGGNLGIGASNWAEGIDPGDFDQASNFDAQNMSVYLYSDRSLYRPGQTVYFRGVLRLRDDMTYSLSDQKTVAVDVWDERGQSVYKKDLTLTPYGTFSDKFDIDPKAGLGTYRIVAHANINDRYSPSTTRIINVAEYRVPEFQVTATPVQKQIVQGDKIQVKVDSTFFFGGPVSHAHVAWTIRSSAYYFHYTGAGYYSFYNYNEDEGFRSSEADYDGNVAKGEGETDDEGKFMIELPSDLGKTKQSQTFTVEADVTDESGRLVAGSTQVTVHQGEFYIGAGPQEYVGTAKQSQKINLLTVDWDSKPVPNTPLSVRAVERIWTSVQTVEPGTGRVVWETNVKENDIAAGVTQTDADGKAVYEFTPPHGGVYKIYATSRDARGNQITTSTFLWVAGPDYVPWRQQNSNRIDLKIDHDSYKVGDTASILIPSPYQGQTTALITVERGHILKTDVVVLANNSSVYKLPITSDMAPNAFVSIVLIKGVDATNPVASFRMGLIQLGVDTERLNLNISIKPDKKQAGPRDQVDYQLRVTNYAGEPVKAEVGVGLVDLASLSLMPDTSTPIMQHFYGQQSLSVRTSSALTMSVDQQTEQILNTVKGGGGGGAEGGIMEIRQEFIDTPLWSPTVTTDDNGYAHVTVKLPDQLTTWRLDARAVTTPMDENKTTLVGQNTFDLISTKPLIIRPVTPRFYVVADTSILAAVVNNNTDQPQDVKAAIDVQGLTIKGDAAQTFTVPAHGRRRFEWPVEVQNVNAVGVTFSAQTTDGKYSDATKSAVGQGDDKTLPVLNYEAPDTVGTGGMIGSDGGSQTEGIVLPPKLSITQGTLDIRAEPSLAASTAAALNVLKNYPYQCIEQTVSRFLPNLMTYRALKQLGVSDVHLRQDLDSAISFALQRLYGEQHSDGGWGWFVQEDSSSLVTAYAVIGLVEAQKQGFNVDSEVIRRAIDLLQHRLEDLNDQATTWKLNRQSFLLYALAYANAGNLSRSVRLFDIREKMSLYARAYLALAFHMMNADKGFYIDPLLSDLQNHALVSATGMHWEEDEPDYFNWNTDTRTTAITLMALSQIDPTNAMNPQVVRWLMIARKSDAWETTQETAWSIMALTEWMKASKETQPDYTYGISLNDKSLIDKQKASMETYNQVTSLQVQVKDLLAGQTNLLTLDRTSGDGVLYYTAHLTAYLPVEQVKAVTRGIGITRTYSLVSDKDRKSITQAHVGDDIRVTLTITAPNDLNYVVITDPIPAGTEAVDPNLPTTGTVGEPPELRLTDPLSRGWGWWWFSKIELRDDKVVLYSSYLPRGTYQFTYTLRAGLAGQYHVIPTTGQEFYFAEVYGRSDGMLFTLLPTEEVAPAPKLETF